MLFNHKFLILTYHRVLTVPDSLRPDQADATMFEQHAKALAFGFNVLSLDDAVIRLRQGRLPNRAVVITFDDGYRDNFTVALPILKKNDLTATFFIATDFLDGGRMWNDTVIEAIRLCESEELDLRHLGLGHWRLETRQQRVEAIDKLLQSLKYRDLTARNEYTKQIESAVGVDLPCDLMMSSEQVRMLAEQGMSIGAHTASHPILARIDAVSARHDIEQGRDHLERVTGHSISAFAYPNGRPDSDYEKAHVDIVRELGFHAAVSTAYGCATSQCDVLQLPRMVAWDHSRFRFTLRLLKTYFAADAARAE